MSGIEVAALIAACSLLGLVVFLVLKLNPVLNKLDKTVNHVNNSIEIITRDVDNLSIEVEGLLNHSTRSLATRVSSIKPARTLGVLSVGKAILSRKKK